MDAATVYAHLLREMASSGFGHEAQAMGTGDNRVFYHAGHGWKLSLGGEVADEVIREAREKIADKLASGYPLDSADHNL